MKRKYLAFDIETAKVQPENGPDWRTCDLWESPAPQPFLPTATSLSFGTAAATAAVRQTE